MSRRDRGGSGKVTTSVKLEPWQKQYLDEHDHLNASGAFRQFVTEFAEGNGRPDGAEYRLEVLETEIEELETELERKRKQRDELKEAIEERENSTDDALERALSTLENLPDDRLNEDNPAVQTQAGKAGVTPGELLAELEKRKDTSQSPAPSARSSN